MAKKKQYLKSPLSSSEKAMLKKIPISKPSATIHEIEKYLLKNTRELETINYIYVKNANGKLVGVLSIKELFRTPKDTRVSEIMVKDLITIRAKTDQERAARLAIKNNLKEIPVVDKNGKFLGIISNDTIMRILQEEHVEDMLISAGIHKFKEPLKNIAGAPVSVHYKKRFPWLLVGLTGGFIIASIISFFEGSLKAYAILLASFMPVIAYIGDAVGNQAQMIFIRSIAIEHKLNIAKYLWREIKVAFLISISISALSSSISYLIWRNALISSVLALSFLLTILISISVAIILPWSFFKIKIDPAIASGPFATMIRDILNITIYFSIAKIIIASAIF